MRHLSRTLASPSWFGSGSNPSKDQNCPSDDELLAFAQGKLDDAKRQILHAHLRRCETCQRLVSEAAHALDPLSYRGIDMGAYSATLRRGSLVANRYRIERFLARGGMGEVYEAYDTELEERVALKTVTATACDSERATRRLKAEVQLARKVSHPHVCRIYDLGVHELDPERNSQIHFLTMEFVDGVSLGDCLRKKGALPASATEQIVPQLLEGLGAAHAAGILHRDFKSDNVMLRRTGPGQVWSVIMDFGLARALDEEKRGLTSGTHRGLVGTLCYMSPEQIEGHELTTASDIYAFGVVWFEMLTGSLPFNSRSAAATALERLYRPAQAPSSIRRTIPPELDAVVLRCLERDPHLRFQTATEVLLAYQAVRQKSVSSARPAKRSNRVAMLASLGLVAVVGAFAWLALEAPAPISAKGSPLASHQNTSLAQPAESDQAHPGPNQVARKTFAALPVPTVDSRALAQSPAPETNLQGAAPATRPRPVHRGLAEVRGERIGPVAERQQSTPGLPDVVHGPPRTVGSASFPLPPVVATASFPPLGPSTRFGASTWENPFDDVAKGRSK